MKSRKAKIKALIQLMGPMRTMLLIGLIDTLPKRWNREIPDGYWIPDHRDIMKTMKVKEPVYWTLMKGIMERGLVTRKHLERWGNVYRIEFKAVEVFVRWSRLMEAARRAGKLVALARAALRRHHG